MASDSDSRTPAKDHDVVLLHGRTDDGEGVRALRSRPGRLEATEIRPMKEGKPLTKGEVVQLLPRQESPLLWDVESKYVVGAEEQPGTRERSGPARFSTRQYRRNWSTIFEKGKTKAKKSNKTELLN